MLYLTLPIRVSRYTIPTSSKDLTREVHHFGENSRSEAPRRPIPSQLMLVDRNWTGNPGCAALEDEYNAWPGTFDRLPTDFITSQTRC